MQNKFVCGPSIHLKGAKMTSRLQLDQDSGMFLYHNPDNDTFQEVDGVMQIIIGVPRENRRVNQMPFLPMRISKGKDRMKAFCATCKKCVMERRKTLCTHNMLQVGAFFHCFYFGINFEITSYLFSEAMERYVYRERSSLRGSIGLHFIFHRRMLDIYKPPTNL